ncbi:DAK2 domain-containing protein [Nocardia sp. CA-107356]|uniref:DAK2 domain-containing protein n=1 Tax=Nocardia sp. CA-107356 TaxID=3239972 RepID=UPI003D8B79A8
MSDGRGDTDLPPAAGPNALDGAALLRWGRICLAGLEQRREEINALNVFPIADADTGTNMLATMRAAMQAVDAVVISAHGSWKPDGDGAAGTALSTHDVAAAMSRGATLGARGNSGIILSQVLRGIAEAARGGPLTAQTLREALATASALVRESLSVPVEGTILTVLDRAADCAAACPESMVAEVAVAAADGAAKALADTPSQLGVLRAAGVVDAGARGLVVLLDSLVVVTLGATPTRPQYVRGEFISESDLERDDPNPLANGAYGDSARHRSAGLQGTAARQGSAGPHNDSAAPDSAEPHFEVMYLLADTDDQRIADLRDRLAELGDSVVVVGDGAGSWSAHVHCADAGAAVEAGIATGTLSDIRIESFAITARPAAAGPSAAGDARSDRDGPADRGVLAVVAGDGAAALFEAGGAVVLSGDGTVTSAALLAAIRQLPNREVLVLPNGALPAHELVAVGVAARDAYRDVLLLPSGSMVQGLAALAVHDCGRIAVDDAFAMSEAAAATRWGSVRAATERALTMVGTCETGDGLGLVGHDVVVIGQDVRSAGRTLLDRMLAFGGELVTLLMGAAAPAELAADLAAHIADGFPGVEVSVYSGGQHADLVQIGVE